MADDTGATGLTAALDLLERQHADALEHAAAMLERRTEVARVLFAGGSLHGLARARGVSKQTIRNDVDHMARHGVTVPVRRATRHKQQEQLPVA